VCNRWLCLCAAAAAAAWPPAGETRKIFIEFLERSCTAEFSGFLLYKELGRRLKSTNPCVAGEGVGCGGCMCRVTQIECVCVRVCVDNDVCVACGGVCLGVLLHL
jgi:hypothetical protein